MIAETSFLREPDPALKAHALETMKRKVDTCWHEYMDVIGEVEKLYEDPTFPKRELAAFVCSKVCRVVGHVDFVGSRTGWPGRGGADPVRCLCPFRQASGAAAQAAAGDPDRGKRQVAVAAAPIPAGR